MQINTVKEKQGGYLINNSISVPNDPANSDYQEIQEWVNNGGIVEPEFTESELLQNAKKDKISKINSQRDSRLIQNTPQTLNVYQGTNLVSKQFQVNPTCYAQWNARVQLLEERKASGEQNPTYPWIALDNEIYDLTLNDFKSLLSHLVDRENTEHIQARLRKDAVNVLTTIQEVEAFDTEQIIIP